MNTTHLAQEASTGNPILNIAVFVVFIVVTMTVVMRAGKTTKEASDFYTGGATFTGTQNGLAIAGDYLSAASFLGIVGAIALNGYDGFLYSIGFFVAWLVALLLVAEPLRNVGRFTMADVLSFRLRQKPVRMAAAFGTLFVTLFYLIAQMAGAGSLVSVLLDLHGFAQQATVIAVVGVIMIAYVLIGGMKGTTYVQMIKAVLLVAGVGVMTVLCFVAIRGGMGTLLQEAVNTHAASDAIQAAGYEPEAILQPGLKYGNTAMQQLDFVSLGLSLVLGTAGLPHVLMRFYTVPTAREARKSVTWAIVLIGSFYLMTLVLGYAAGALVGPDRILSAPGGANAAAPLLALELGGSIFMALISAVAFATVLAVVAGLAITASASVGRDIYDAVLRDGKSSEEEQVRVSRITVVVIGIASIILGILAMEQNVAFLVSLAFAIAASANLPTILFSLYWKKFNTTGAVASMYTGLTAALVLIFFSPAVSGAETAMVPGADWSFFPLTSPGLVSIPLAFLAGIIGTYLGKPDNLDHLAAEMEVRSLTGVGVEAPVDH
ncbi:solute symporter family protein [Corynebacterium halotolerans]|uniref:Putative transport membrane protein n=1 Tax=Corynebacterium halotolerans YIM 70093 = DSM 44683 TaxID=1121362 RepID=M1NQP2_9CORY|nr:cation/acetate symporter ActP [Corynebacterium halotolerans]AGF71837.1 putative transport membrane protein [Corynebacterium halotolerans YIM 70093 = DSM 44683]